MKEDEIEAKKSSNFKNDGSGKYKLIGFVSHLGSNLSSGHYVCHLLKNDQWCVFNDEKVAKSKNPPFRFGYLYFFVRAWMNDWLV